MLELMTLACAGLFSGVALYVSIVQQPAVRELGDEVAARYFVPMYRRAAPLQAGLAAVGTVSGVWAWLTGSSSPWLVGALLLGLSIPVTLVVIKPVNDRLLAPDLDPASRDVPHLLARWSRLHALRTLASLASFGVCAFARAVG